MKIIRHLLSLSLLLIPFICSAGITISQMRTNGLVNPLGTDPDAKHSLSWILSSDEQNTEQQAYRILVISNGNKIWDSGKVMSDNSTSVIMETELSDNTFYEWILQVWDNHGNCSKKYSSTWQTGIPADAWEAEWISAGVPAPTYFRKNTEISGRIKKATAYITSHGIYEAYINGQRVGNHQLTPGWTSYAKRLQYQAYDITDILGKGENTIAAIVSPGWYSGGMNVGNPKKRYKYGEDVSLLMQIIVEYIDGRKETIITDEEWDCCVPAEDNTAKAGGITFANIYDGQTIDGRLIDRNWAGRQPQTLWTRKAIVLDMPKNHITATVNEPVKTYEAIPAVKYIVTPKGEKVIDFGQNIVGWEKVKLSGKKGDIVRITHAEVLDKEGNFYTENMRAAKTTSTFILNGDTEEIFEPRHTFYGFRYIKVEGVEGDLDISDYIAVPISSGFDRIGHFSCSDPVINQLQHNIEWGFWDNFVDIPTDCPQRDERLGWTGDAHIFYRTAAFLGKVDMFFTKWLNDLKVDQKEDGRVPRVIPNTYKGTYRTAATGWADACTIIPWNQYMAFGDLSILENQYDSMKSWVDYMISQSEGNGWLWNNGSHYGDWLFYSLPNDPRGESAVTSRHLVAQCFYANSVDIVSWTAALLGKDDDAKYYYKVASNVRQAYMNEYVTPNGLISSDTQTAYVLALEFNMLPENLRSQAMDRLIANIKRYKDHITTGFLGTSYICNVLTENGRSDIAYKLLLQETCPSWIYSVKKGATTIWERWNSIMEDGSIIDGMNSFNHYSYGSIGDWLYRSAVGIKEGAPGYKRIIIQPHPGGDFTYMEASTITPYGKVSAHWTAEDNILKSLKVEIPVNTTAEIFIPAESIESINYCSELKPVGYNNGHVVFKTGSGKYTFTVSD